MLSIYKNECFIFGLCWSFLFLCVSEQAVWGNSSGGYDGRFYSNGCENENIQVSDNDGWWQCTPTIMNFGCDIVYTEIRAGYYCRAPKPVSSQPYWPPIHLYCEQFTPYRISYYHEEAHLVGRSAAIISQCSQQLAVVQLWNIANMTVEAITGIAERFGAWVMGHVAAGTTEAMTQLTVMSTLSMIVSGAGYGITLEILQQLTYDVYWNIPTFVCCAFICNLTMTEQYAHLPSCSDVWQGVG